MDRISKTYLYAMLAIATAIAIIAVLLSAAQAHEKWWNGKEVDPATKRYCCGDNDVTHLERGAVRITPGGYLLADTGETIPFARAQPSVDGEYWVFRWGAPQQTQCFFAPLGAS